MTNCPSCSRLMLASSNTSEPDSATMKLACQCGFQIEVKVRSKQ